MLRLAARPLTNHRQTLNHINTITITIATARSSTMSDSIQRNPHPDFQKVQASRTRPSNPPFTYTQTASPSWTFGAGANSTPSSPKAHIPINPYSQDRPAALNYKLLISAIVPRPVAFLSTVSSDGRPNLAPFSYFNMMNHDPPIFVIGFASPVSEAKDSLKNLLDTKEGVINIISDDYVEAANSTSINAPFGISEWDVSGLTPVRGEGGSQDVKAPRVKEAVFSVEVKLDMVKEWESRQTGRKTGTMVVLEGLRFWVREDAINEDRSLVDPAVLRPIGRLGGITYSRTNEGFELLRPKFEEDLGGEVGLKKIKEQK